MALPSGVTGPRDFEPLAREAWICFSVRAGRDGDVEVERVIEVGVLVVEDHRDLTIARGVARGGFGRMGVPGSGCLFSGGWMGEDLFSPVVIARPRENETALSTTCNATAERLLNDELQVRILPREPNRINSLQAFYGHVTSPCDRSFENPRYAPRMKNEDFFETDLSLVEVLPLRNDFHS